MLFVIASEIIPETAREETKTATTSALLAGFLATMSLDVVLGGAGEHGGGGPRSAGYPAGEEETRWRSSSTATPAR